MKELCLLALVFWGGFLGNVGFRLCLTMKSWLPKLHVGSCHAIDFVLMGLFIFWGAIVVALAPAAFFGGWLIDPPAADALFVVPIKLVIASGSGLAVGVIKGLLDVVWSKNASD